MLRKAKQLVIHQSATLSIGTTRFFVAEFIQSVAKVPLRMTAAIFLVPFTVIRGKIFKH